MKIVFFDNSMIIVFLVFDNGIIMLFLMLDNGIIDYSLRFF